MSNSVLRTDLESVHLSPSTEILLLGFSLISSDFLICYTFSRLVENIHYVYANENRVGIRDNVERLFPVFKLLSSFCLDCILYGVGHKIPGMPPWSLNPYRSVQCYIWDTFWLIQDNVSAVCLPTVLP